MSNTNPAQYIEQIYDFEGAFEAAGLALLTGVGLPGCTRLTRAKLAAPVPRVEIRFDLGQEAQQYITCPNGSRRNYAWLAKFIFQPVTNPKEGTDAPQSPTLVSDTHGYLRAATRNALFDIGQKLNSILLYHTINNILSAGTTPALKASDTGYEYSTLHFDLHFNIRPTAWPQSLAPTPQPQTTTQ